MILVAALLLSSAEEAGSAGEGLLESRTAELEPFLGGLIRR